jgi:4-alpha-glucanotransferase
MTLRSSGILLHPASLPGRFGIGDLGPTSLRFVDFLARAGQHLWQMLPLNPTRAGGGHSPYYSPSTHAGNPLLISPEILCRQGFLTQTECGGFSDMPEGRIDYSAVENLKEPLLAKACERLRASRHKELLETFNRRNADWLDSFALFSVLNRHFKTPTWCDWPAALRDRNPEALQEAARQFAPAIARQKALQFFFFQQWRSLRKYCHQQNIRIFGDMPIYVPLHSADVWAHPQCFKLGFDRRPTHVSGVPPDYFSETGQLWGHPVYDWDRIRADGFDWWLGRIERHLFLYDLFRIDHFRGLVAYWEVAADADTALNGQWQPAPVEELLTLAMRRLGHLPVVAEDLGIIDADVREVMSRWCLPGMKVLQFAFGDDFPQGAFVPHHHIRNCVVYTGTHDNNTIVGWFTNEANEAQKKRLFDYLGRQVDPQTVAWEMIRLALQSVADTVVIPVQDLLSLDESARINHPARQGGNWRWRLTQRQLAEVPADRLAAMTRTYSRDYT